MKLIIVESPAKVKTISKFLGKDFKIMSTIGHIVDLPQKRIGVTMNDSIEIDYEPLPDKQKIINQIRSAAAKADEIFLAPDPDREGEIIAWHTFKQIEHAIKKKTPIYRIAFNEITKPAILEAVSNPGEIDMKKVAAQQARRVLDRWVGYEVSPVLWDKVTRGLSAGRVQSVALRLITEREQEIRNFKPEEYWTIHGLFAKQKQHLETQLANIGKKKAEIKTETQAKSLVTDIKECSFTIAKISDKERKKNPSPPFMTSSLQQTSYTRLGFGVKKTMQLAQKLYEGVPLEDSSSPVALITYMRTDSLRLSEIALKQARAFIEDTFDKTYLPTRAQRYAKSTKKKKETTQDAHEAIRPIDVNRTPESVSAYLKPDMAKLYALIWNRFVASQMMPANYATRQVSVVGGKYTFKASGSTLLFDGYLRVWGKEKEEQKNPIPTDIAEKDLVALEKIDPKQHFTQPPPRFTEGSLVKTLEKEGIGRPSTYASILNTIQARSYTTLENKKFIPTELGTTVTELLVENLPHVMNLSFTAEMELDLDKIARAEMERDTLLREFYETFSADLEKFRGSEKKRRTQPTEIDCPSCKEDKLLIRFGKAGEFLGCARFPECNFTSNFSRDEDGIIKLAAQKEPELLDRLCPNCSKPLRQIIGRYGPFVACSGYPECKFIEQVIAPVDCPSCGSKLVQKRWRGGSFWGCATYPKCKTAVWGTIVKTPCSSCKGPFMSEKTDKTGKTTLTCPKSECQFSTESKPNKA